MPTRIIAHGKINLDKLKTTLCPNIKQSRSSHFFIQFFIVIVSRQPDYGSRLYFSYSLAGHEINRKSLDKWVKLWVDYFKDISIGVNCIPDPFKAVISKRIVTTTGELYLINFNWGKSSLLPFPKAHTSLYGLIMLLVHLTKRSSSSLLDLIISVLQQFIRNFPTASETSFLHTPHSQQMSSLIFYRGAKGHLA